MELHQFLEAFADLQVSGDQLVRQFRTAAYDLEIAPVPHEPLNEVVVDAQDDHHVGVGTAGLMDLVGVDHDEFAGNQLVLASLQIDGRISVQYVDKFQGIMPMGRSGPRLRGYCSSEDRCCQAYWSLSFVCTNLPFQMGKRKNYQNEECCRNEPES